MTFQINDSSSVNKTLCPRKSHLSRPGVCSISLWTNTAVRDQCVAVSLCSIVSVVQLSN